MNAFKKQVKPLGYQQVDLNPQNKFLYSPDVELPDLADLVNSTIEVNFTTFGLKDDCRILYQS